MAADLRSIRITVKTKPIELVARYLKPVRRGCSVRLLLQGERGVGKRTAINYALKNHPALGELVILRGSADQFRSPLAPIAEAFSCLIEGSAHNDHVLRAASRVANDLGQLVPFFSTLGGRVRDLYQSHTPTHVDYPLLDAGDLLFRTQKVLRALAFEFHPILIFHDIEQYDLSSLSMLSQLAQKEDLDCSFIFTFDPYALDSSSQDLFKGFESALTSRRLFKRIKFSRFLLEHSERYIDGVLGRGVASREKIAALHTRTGGNPLFLREMLAHLAEEGHISSTAGRRRLSDAYLEATLPDTIRDLIEIKIQRLPHDLRTIVDLASVIGTEFQPKPISEGLELSNLIVLDRLRKLEMAYNLVEQMANIHRFSLEAVREAVYESLGPALAREHHLLLARYFESHSESPDVDYLLYYHYRRAHFPDKSAEHLVKSAYSARARLSHEEAAHRFCLAQDLVTIFPAASAQINSLKLEEGISHFDSGDFTRSLSRLLELSSNSSDRRLRAICLLYISLAQYMLDDPASAACTLDNLFCGGYLDLSLELRIRALMTRASVLYALGSWDEARKIYLKFIKEVPRGADVLLADALKRVNIFYLPELALPLLRKAQKRIEAKRNLPLYWEIHHNIGGNYLILGDLQSAEIYFREAFTEFDKMGTYRVTYPLNNLGLVKMFCGEMDEARTLFNQVKSIARVDFDRMSAICHLALIDCLLGNPEKAIPQLELLSDRAKNMSEAILVELIFHNLAWAYSLAGDSQKALLCIQDGPGVAKDLWSDFRLARRQRMIAHLSAGSHNPREDEKKNILDWTGRRDSWLFKDLAYEVNDIWCWE